MAAGRGRWLGVAQTSRVHSQNSPLNSLHPLFLTSILTFLVRPDLLTLFSINPKTLGFLFLNLTTLIFYIYINIVCRFEDFDFCFLVFYSNGGQKTCWISGTGFGDYAHRSAASQLFTPVDGSFPRVRVFFVKKKKKRERSVEGRKKKKKKKKKKEPSMVPLTEKEK
ncbi:hypothetical protein CsatB_008480 [Cannabis sativa]